MWERKGATGRRRNEGKVRKVGKEEGYDMIIAFWDLCAKAFGDCCFEVCQKSGGLHVVPVAARGLVLVMPAEISS